MHIQNCKSIYDLVWSQNKGKTITYGDILYINLSIQDKNLEYFLFETQDGFKDYLGTTLVAQGPFSLDPSS